MQIEGLRLVITDSDLNDLAFRFLPAHEKLRGLYIGIVPQGIRVTGTYQAAIGVPFESLWGVFVCEGKLAARLLTLKTGFLSLGLAQGYVLRAIAGAANIVDLSRDMLLVDLDALLHRKGVSLRTNLKFVRCGYGDLVIECGRSD